MVDPYPYLATIPPVLACKGSTALSQQHYGGSF